MTTKTKETPDHLSHLIGKVIKAKTHLDSATGHIVVTPIEEELETATGPEWNHTLALAEFLSSLRNFRQWRLHKDEVAGSITLTQDPVTIHLEYEPEPNRYRIQQLYCDLNLEDIPTLWLDEYRPPQEVIDKWLDECRQVCMKPAEWAARLRFIKHGGKEE